MATSGSGGRKSASGRSSSGSAKAKRKPSGAGGSRRSARSGAAAKRGGGGRGVEAKTVAEFREALRKNLIRPREIVMLSRERIEEVLGEAVDQGRVTARDAQRITSGLVKRGQKQTTDVLKDLEQLVGRGRDEIGGRGSGAREKARGARGRAVRSAAPALDRIDRVRRGAGVGPSFPITGYDELTAAQVQSRLGSLTPAQLRKVRDHERRNANRKTVLNAIESKLG